MLSALALLALPVAGCGGSSFADDYKPVDAELHRVGLDLVAALQGANKQTNAQFAATIRALQHRVSDVEAKLKALGPPPDDVKADFAALRANLRKVDNDMITLATHVSVNDVAGTRTAARSLIDDARAVTPHVVAIRKKLGLPQPSS